MFKKWYVCLFKFHTKGREEFERRIIVEIKGYHREDWVLKRKNKLLKLEYVEAMKKT